MKFKELKFERSNPQIKINKLIDYKEFCGIKDVYKDNYDQISCKDLKKIIDINSKNLFLIDVRSQLEREIDYIKNSVSIPLENIKDNSKISLIKGKNNEGEKIILYCKSGIRSLEALNHLKNNNIICKSLEGGLDNWNKFIVS